MLSYTDFSSAFEMPESQKKAQAEETAKRTEEARKREEWLARQTLPYWEYSGVRIPWEIRRVPSRDDINYVFYVEDFETGSYQVAITAAATLKNMTVDEYRKKYAKQAEDGSWWYDPGKSRIPVRQQGGFQISMAR